MKHKTLELNKFFKAVNPNLITVEKDILYFNSGIFSESKEIDNGMPQFLAQLVNTSSSVHANLCRLKGNLIKGNGLEIQYPDEINSDKLSDFISKRNKSGQNLRGVYANAAKDYSVFEAACLQVIFNRDAMIAEIYHVPVQDVRMHAPNQYGQIEWYYISKNWASISNVRNKKVNATNSAVRIRAFDPTLWKEYPVQMLYISEYSPDTYYAVPSYVASLNWITIERLISEYELGNLKTNYFIAGMLTQQGQPQEEEMNNFIRDFESLYAGVGQQGNKSKMIFSWVDDLASQTPQFTPLQTQNVDLSRTLEIAEKKICVAHSAYPRISGILVKTSDLGGDGNSLYTELKAYSQLIVAPMRETLLDGFNRIMEVNQYPTVITNVDEIRVVQPVAQPDDLTLEERREMVYGLKTEKITDTTPNDEVEETPES